MRHLLLSREYPPAVYPPGGIGTYALHIARALAERGETVHVIAERWEGAPRRVERQVEGRLVVHRIAAGDAELYPSLAGGAEAAAEVEAMRRSPFPEQWFSWVAAGLAERLVESEGIEVIEGQEWEAPLYHLLLRRALGLGPTRAPPVFVHLHSPTEFIFRHNDWPPSRPDYLPMTRLETFTIRAADALLCPSRFLASACEARFGLAGPVEVIPLPLGENPVRARPPSVWAEGPLVFCGRLEPRKGVIELVDAAVAVMRDEPGLRVELVGGDNRFNARTSVRELLDRRIPEALRDRFTFHGSQPRSRVLEILGRARAAVVPSRWENFPNTCLEAMASGLPVLASRNGGMADMIEDESTGWLAADGPEALADRLEAALRRAVATPPERLAAMGRAAAAAIRALCGDDEVAERHIAFRARLAREGARRSRSFPEAYPWPGHPRRPRPVPAAAEAPRGLRPPRTAVAVIALQGRDPDPALRSLARQTRWPDRVLVVSDRPPEEDHVRALHLPYGGPSRATAQALALEAADLSRAKGGEGAERWMVLDGGTTLHARALEALGQALDRVPAAGLAVGWSARPGAPPRIEAAPPAFPAQWFRDEIDGPVLFRAAALLAAARRRPDLSQGHEDWALATGVMAEGWQALRVPALLAATGAEAAADAAQAGQRSHAAAAIAAPDAELAGLDALDILGLLLPEGEDAPAAAAAPPGRTQIESLGWVLRLPLRDQARLAALALRRPDWALRWLAWRAQSRLGHGRRDDGR